MNTQCGHSSMAAIANDVIKRLSSVNHGTHDIENVLVGSAVNESTNSKERAQILVEVVHSRDNQATWSRPIAIRYANGHTMGPQGFLDPSRIAAAMSTSFLEIARGFFHDTPISRIRNIIKQGLLPGTVMQHRGRMDIHAAMF